MGIAIATAMALFTRYIPEVRVSGSSVRIAISAFEIAPQRSPDLRAGLLLVMFITGALVFRLESTNEL